MENKAIGERIKARRKELNLTQKQIQAATGISTGNLSEIENGSKSPSAHTTISLSNALHCTTDWILKGVSLQREIYEMDEDTRELVKEFKMLPASKRKKIMAILHLEIEEIRDEKNLNSKLSG